MAFILGGAISLIACSPADEATTSNALTAELIKKNEVLEAKVAKLQAENKELRESPQQLLNEVMVNSKNADVDKSKIALQRLINKHPLSDEAVKGTRLVDELIAKLEAAELETKRMAALGFKALKITPTFTYNGNTAKLSSASIGKRWIFDAYGDEYRYVESEKSEIFITAKLNFLSKSKDPSLFGIGIYVVEGAVLKHLGNFSYRFARWDDYASYLGNNADYRNDFAHSSSIPFSLGVSVSDDNLKQPLYLVISREGCHTRHTERFNNPPVSYFQNTCDSLKKTLTIDDFKDGSLAILKRLN